MKVLNRSPLVIILSVFTLLVISGCGRNNYQGYVDTHSGEKTNNAIEISSSKLRSEWQIYDRNTECLQEIDFLSSWSKKMLCRELYIYSVQDKLLSSEIISVTEEKVDDVSYIKVETKHSEQVFFLVQHYKVGTGTLVAVWKDSPDDNGILLFASLTD